MINTTAIKEKILEEFNKKFVGKCPSHHDPNTHQNVSMIWEKKMLDIKELESFLSSAFDRYTWEVIEMVDAYNLCLSDIQRRAGKLLGKKEIVITMAPCCRHTNFTSTCCCHCHPSSPNTYIAK